MCGYRDIEYRDNNTYNSVILYIYLLLEFYR